MSNDYNPNLSYQDAQAKSGGSYTQKKLKAISLPDLSGKRFLDLGCNAGFYCGYALDQGASRVVGVDGDPKVIQKAREQHPGAQFFDTGWDVFPDGEFDVVICLSAIHYAKDPIALLENIHAHLSRDGVFILECGIFGALEGFNTDILVPAWRQIGDRCRHLSHGFMLNHLLRSYSWSIVGESEFKSGDPVPRFVIHAKPANAKQDSGEYQIDLVEYAKCLAQSSEYISSKLPSHSYVSHLGSIKVISVRDIESILGNSEFSTTFTNDLIYALGKRRPLYLTINPGLSAEANTHLGSLLRKHDINLNFHTINKLPTLHRGPALLMQDNSGFNVSVSTEQTSTFKTFSEIIPVLEKIPNNMSAGILREKIVVDLATGDPGISDQLLRKGIRKCYVVTSAVEVSDNDRLTFIKGDPWDIDITGVDTAFFDYRGIPGFHPVDDLIRLINIIPYMLKPDGVLFAILPCSANNSDFDVANSIDITSIGPTPSLRYLLDQVLHKYAVRILDSSVDSTRTVATRLFRLTVKKPTLLLVFGHSQSGKTSLAREFKSLDSHMHVSNDYIYSEIVQLKKKGIDTGISPEILGFMGDGGGVACGKFNRELDANRELLEMYLDIVMSVIPRNKNLITIEFDLRNSENHEIVKKYFIASGYSVWTISR